MRYSASVTPGTVIADRYVVRRSLGDGGLASALLVHDPVWDVELALKLVSSDEGARGALEREFVALRSCVHPRLVRVHDFGYWRARGGRRAYYTSSVVRGTDLRTFASSASPSLTWETLERPVGDVLAALGSLHRRGLLHGDVHPGNILVEPDGRAVLIDLSCVRRLAFERVTDVSGTAGYVAPELSRGLVHRTADLFALGMAVRATGVALPARVARGIARLTAERPEDRPESAEEAAAALGIAWAAPPASELLGGEIVGRDDVLAQADLALEALSRAEPGARTIAILGDEGVGRSRFLEELKVRAQLRTKTVLVPGRAGALATLLAIACGHPLDATSLSATVKAFERLAADRAPIVLLVDDADALPHDERARLAALGRMATPGGTVLLVTASKQRLEGTRSALELPLAPLDAAHLRAWLRAHIPETAVTEIVRATAGYPKEVAALLAQLEGAAWDSRTLARGVAAAGVARGTLSLDGLSEDARVLLGRIVAAGAVPAASSSALEQLVRRGLVVTDLDGARLHRRSDAERAASALGPSRMESAHRALASEAEAALAREPHRDDLRASAVVHLAAFDPPRAARVLAASPAGASATVLRRAADAVLATNDVDDDTAVRCAEIYADGGEPARGIAVVTTRLRRRPPHPVRDALRAIAGRCYARIGDSRRAARILTPLLPRLAGRREHPAVAASLSLALLKRGNDVAALEVARSVLASDASIEPATRLDLLLDAAFATSRGGATDDARTYLARARELADAASARGRFRLASATAFVEYGAGQTPAAARAYKVALELAEQHGLDDVIASAAMNYGSACHELGELGRALDAYERGQRIAAALGMPTTEATLEFDRAKAYADIGSFDRAERHARAAADAARREGMALLEGGALAVLAEGASARGEHEVAARHLEAAARLVKTAGEREVVALSVQRAHALLAAGDVGMAAQEIARSAALVQALGTPDSEAAWLGARSAVASAQGRGPEAIADLERAVELATSTGQRALLADVEARLADAFEAAGSGFLADRHRARARELWEKMLATLPPELHDAFRRHPRRARTFAPPVQSTESAAPPVDVRRILEINRRLNSASSTAEVLEETMDAAISLTRAERGFLLVDTRFEREGASALKVTVARNMDRETIRQGNLKFSRTVAERVVRTGEPVIAVDAGFDPRFAKARSVHAMKLKSLLCVPIRSPDGILGAIYVDHRFSSGSFRAELADVLLALGDQAALALGKARLLEELRRKTKELEERNAEVEQLARGQAQEIARLRRTIDRDEGGSDTAKRRFDYGDMVARSTAMRRILSVLDRVIDTDITVLVRGESGTGKERIARAVHANSSRASGPFVAINCGALPEPLLEAELFGYRRGAFSGAARDQPGLFVSARGGTLFLDELGEMPPSMQVKLLRVLQEHEVRPLGANDAVPTDVRLVCATNRKLAEEVRAGRFREDLYYRVAVVEVELPPLRERLEDILPLAEATLGRLATELGRPEARLDRRAERALLAHAWPGNVRELENVLTKAFLLGKGTVLDADDLELGGTHADASAALGTSTSGRARSVALRARITATLEEADWNVVLAARLLGMPRATLYRKMRLFGIVRPERATL